MVKSEFRARYSETDQMGIIHHSHYINWFEVGRTDFIRTLGMSYAEMENKGILLPVISSQVFYRSPARYEDLIEVETRIGEYNGIRIKFNYRVVKQTDQTLIAEGYTEHCWTNSALRPISLKRTFSEHHEKVMQAFREGE